MMLSSIALLCFISSGVAGLPSNTKATDNVVQRDNSPGRDGYQIHKAIAFGDSYTANPGAGKKQDDDPRFKRCKVYTQNWPKQLEDSNRLHGFTGNPVPVDNYACSGAVLSQIEDQAQNLPPNSVRDIEMVLLTGGGNDLGFADILQVCLYGYEGGQDKCNNLLDNARQLINSDGFGQRIGRVLSAYSAKQPRTHIYWMGYPRLFSEDPNDNCDTKCFRIEINQVPVDPRCPKWRQMSVNNRQTYNNLVDNLNHAVKAVIAAQPSIGPTIKYVDVDAAFRGHRFCSASTRSLNKPNDDIYFYPLSQKDVEFKESDFDGFDTSICYDRDALQNADVDTQFNCAVWVENHNSGNSTERVVSRAADQISLADAKLRAFHPTIRGALIYATHLADFYLGNDDLVE